MSEETAAKCPQCGSELVIQVANQKHCNSCGAEFALERDPVGKRARTEKVGWPPNPARTAG